jgi:enoyl-[acyl-carrier protein] reductase I
MGAMLKHHAERAPLRRNVEAREVGNAALFLLSPLSSGITGEVLHVDCGFNIMAL